MQIKIYFEFFKPAAVLSLFFLSSFSIADSIPTFRRLDGIYMGFYHLPSFSKSVANRVSPFMDLSTLNTLLLNYRVTQNYGVGLVLTTDVYPFDFSRSFFQNPALRLIDNRSIDDLKLMTDLRFILPLNWNENLSQQRVTFGLRVSQLSTYRPKMSPFWFSSFNWFLWTWFGQQKSGRQGIIHTRTAFYYNVNDKIIPGILTLIQLVKQNSVNDTVFTVDNALLGPGLYFEVSKQFNISPFITMNLMSPSFNAIGFYTVAQARF